MAQTYPLTESFSLSDGGEGLALQNAQGEKFVFSDNSISKNGVPLSSQEARTFCNDLLCSALFLPEHTIFKTLQLKETNKLFSFKLETEKAENNTVIELQHQPETTTLNRLSTDIQKNGRSMTTSTHKIKSLRTASLLEYTSQTEKTEKVSSEKFRDTKNTSLTRQLKNGGHRIILSREDDERNVDFFDEFSQKKLSLDISHDSVSYTSIGDSVHTRHKLKATYDFDHKTIHCRLKKRDYDAITIVEYKPTILTHATGKKVKVTTFIDRDFDGVLEISADGAFTYKQTQTANDGSLETFKTTENMDKVAADIRKAVEKIKTVVGKISLLRQSQHNPTKIDFAQNPSIFDEDIDFTDIKAQTEYKLTEAFARGNSDIHKRFLAALVNTANSGSNSGMGDLAFNTNHHNER